MGLLYRISFGFKWFWWWENYHKAVLLQSIDPLVYGVKMNQSCCCWVDLFCWFSCYLLCQSQFVWGIASVTVVNFISQQISMADKVTALLLSNSTCVCYLIRQYWRCRMDNEIHALLRGNHAYSTWNSIKSFVSKTILSQPQGKNSRCCFIKVQTEIKTSQLRIRKS